MEGPKAKPKVSIILRSYNEERWIGPCLNAIFAQEFKDFEVILVDNCSTDKTVEKAKKFSINILTIEKFMPGLALNIGIRASVGQYFVCLSAHCIPVNNKWLGTLVSALDRDLEQKPTAAVYGRQEPMSFTLDHDKRDLLTVFGLDRKVQYKDSFFHNANSIIRRDLWEKIPFDETTTNIEDRIWAREIIKQDYCIIYEPEASVYHWHGIHQDRNAERCRNVVKIIEGLNIEGGQHQKHLDIEDLNILCIVPVRGEVLYLNERPLLEYTLETAKKSKFIKRIIVSTDDASHAELATRAGVDVPFLRDGHLSAEYVDIEQVYKHTLEKLEECQIIPDIVVALEITYPFRSVDFIDEMILKLVREGLDSVCPVRLEYTQTWQKTSDSIVKATGSFGPRKFSDPLYVSLKGLGVVTYPNFLRAGELLGPKVGIAEIDNPYSHVEVRDQKTLSFASRLMPAWIERKTHE